MWAASHDLLEDDSQQGNTPVPQIARALTELFLLVENVAEDWGMAQDHLIDMLTTEGLNTWLEKVGVTHHVICWTRPFTTGYQ